MTEAVLGAAALGLLASCQPAQPWSSELAGVDETGAGSSGLGTSQGAISPDGTKVAFVTSASDLGPTDTNGADDVYRHVAYHSLGTAAFDVYVVEDEADVATATPVATDISSGEASAYVTVDAETYFVVLTEVGEKDEVLSVPNVDLTTGKIRTIVVAEKAWR